MPDETNKIPRDDKLEDLPPEAVTGEETEQVTGGAISSPLLSTTNLTNATNLTNLSNVSNLR
jgi:hypothetical protein